MLMKFTLSFTVVFTCVICYLLAPNVNFGNSWLKIIELFIYGMMVTGAANAINQAVEGPTDAMMKRTANRPVASGRMSRETALTIAGVMGIAGVVAMGLRFNMNAGWVSAASLVLYAFIYTPLKKVNSIAVLVGALPGALPCLIGWVAATDSFSLTEPVMGTNVPNANGWALFAIQFLWQFPHFWAIAWVAHADYSRAGFKLLPADKGPTKFTAVQGLMYSVLMVPVGMLNYYMGLTGMVSLVIVLLANLGMVVQSVRLLNEMDAKAARRVMFSSYIYLPIVYLALLFDKVV